MRRIVVDATQIDERAIDQIAHVVLDGGVIGLPTDTFYAIAADPWSQRAVARIFDLKGRSAARALPLIAADEGQVSARIGALAPLARMLADRFWPGPLTLLLPAPAPLAETVAAGTGKVAVRVPAHAIARAICAACDRPLTATSANMTGMSPSGDPDEIVRTLGDRLTLLVDAGPTAGGLPSTIIDTTNGGATLVRAGAIPWEEIEAWVHGG